MRIVKLAVISFVFLFGMITLMSVFIPSRIRISRATNLPRTGIDIIKKIADTSSWDQWHPGFMRTDSTGPVSGLKRIPVSGSTTEFLCKVQQDDKKAVTNGWKLYGNSTSDSLTLQWYMDFRLSWYPWQKFSSLFYESSYGSMMEQGLTNLKTSIR
jgi:hypothetical protein